MATRFLLTALTALATFQQATAQTFTDCNPMEKDCPADTALGARNVEFDMSQNANGKVWNMTAGPMKYASQGAEFTIRERGQSPTIRSEFYIMWGSLSVMLQAAKGQGIVSSIVLQSDDLDEIDWEWIGGNNTHVQTNFFGKGNTTSYDRAAWHEVSTPQDQWHNYTVEWTKEKMEWFIDGASIRVTEFAGKGTNGGLNYPQTPMDVRLGIWAGGDPKQPQGVIDWAGGLTSFDDVYTMRVKSLQVSDYSEGKEYTWSDRSGSWQSIKATSGNSTVLNEIYEPSGVNAVWTRLSAGAKSGIVIGAIAGAGIIVAGLLLCCIIQGRKGKKEKAIADAAYEKEQAEFNQYRMQMMKGGFSASAQPVAPSYSYDPKTHAPGYVAGGKF